MIFQYTKDNQGNDKFECLRSSMVEKYEKCKSGIIVETVNSIYYFEKI